MNTTTTELNRADVTRMALLAGKVVNGMDFDEANYAEAKAQFIKLIDELDARYANSELLFDARAAVLSMPVRKMDMYMIAQTLTRLARKDKPSVADRLTTMPGMGAQPVAQNIAQVM